MPSRANTTVRAVIVAGGSERRVPPQRVDARHRERPDLLDVQAVVGLQPANVVGERPQVTPVSTAWIMSVVAPSGRKSWSAGSSPPTARPRATRPER